jgi:hypothetical protein
MEREQPGRWRSNAFDSPLPIAYIRGRKGLWRREMDVVL